MVDPVVDARRTGRTTGWALHRPRAPRLTGPRRAHRALPGGPPRGRYCARPPAARRTVARVAAAAEEIRLEGVSKVYADGTVGVAELDLTFAAGELTVLVGPSGCGKTTTMKMINRIIEPTDRPDPARRRGRHPGRPRRSCAAGSATSSRTSGSSRTRRCAPTSAPCPGCSAGTSARIRARVDELLDHGRPGPRRLRRPLPGPALRRPAPAGRRRPRAGRRPAGAADGRAVLRRRPDRPRAAAGGVPAAAGDGAQDDRVRHPRHRGGGADRRPDRGDEPGRPRRAVRHPGRAARAGRPAPFVADFVGRRPRAQAAGGHRHRRRRPRAAAGGARRRRAGRRPGRAASAPAPAGPSSSTTTSTCTAGCRPSAPRAPAPSARPRAGWRPGCRWTPR